MLCCCLRGKVAAAIAAAIGSVPCPAPGAYNGCLARFPHSKAIEQTVPHKCFCAREVADLAHLNKGDTYRAACVANRRPQDCSRKDPALPRLSYWGKNEEAQGGEDPRLRCTPFLSSRLRSCNSSEITDLHEMIAAVIRSALVDEALGSGLRARLDDMKERLWRLEVRASKKRSSRCRL